MLRSLFSAMLGALLIVGATNARAVPVFTQLAPVQAGEIVTVRGDYTSPGLIGFDLHLLPVPAEIPLLYAADVLSDGGFVLYQLFGDVSGNYDSGSLVGGGSGGINIGSAGYPAGSAGTGNLGFKVTDYSGGTQGFSIFDLVFRVLPGTASGDYIVPFVSDLYSVETGTTRATGSITIRVSGTVPVPAVSLLILSGLGALFAVRRRRRV